MGRFINGGAEYKSGETSVEKEIKRTKVKGWVDVLLCIVIVAVVLLYRESTDSQRNKVVFSQDRITLICTEEDSCDVIFDQFTSVELFNDFSVFDKGELLRGTDTRSGCSGVFRNEEFGEYCLCVTPSFEKYLVVRQSDSVIVFNYESKYSTEDVYGFLLQILDDRQA